MTSIQATADSASRKAGQDKWRFSIGTLFRVTAVCALTMFAAVQFGPLAATRVLGIGLAVVFAIQAWSARWRWLWLGSAVAAFGGFIPTILAAGAPFSERSGLCLECGMTRETHEVCGWVTKDDIRESEASRWAAPLVPAGHQHVWTTMSLSQRSHWFGYSLIGCGGPGEGAFMAWQLARLGDQPAAEQAYREYQDILTGASAKSMATHRQEMNAAVEAAVRARQ